jgi:hypothetical protein
MNETNNTRIKSKFINQSLNENRVIVENPSFSEIKYFLWTPQLMLIN